MAFTANNHIELPFVFLTLQALNKKMITISTGSIQRVINNNHVDEFNFPYSNQISMKFGEVTIKIFDKLMQIAIENRKLVTLRDWLLPMLMNGQAIVAN